MSTMLFSRCQLRYTYFTVPIEFQYRSRSSFPLRPNRLTRWHVSFFFVPNRTQRGYYLFPRISFFIVAKQPQCDLSYLYSRRSEPLCVEFLLGTLFAGFDHNWCGARAYSVCHVVDRGSPVATKFPAIRARIARFSNVDLSSNVDRVIRYFINAHLLIALLSHVFVE